MKASVSPELCIGCGLCAEICPEVFVMGEDNLAHAINEDAPAAAHESVQDAATACPVEAITLS